MNIKTATVIGANGAMGSNVSAIFASFGDAKVYILGRAAFYEKEGQGIDFPFPKLFGRLADEILKKYDVDEERFMNALARISANNYANAKRNPMAQTKKVVHEL